ncbi:MAG TPA: DUF4304 domain-containing protein [Planctomicrobium sp.]|nr:DUF4304 domain-containing protein [Planctomicrobium sp.]
MTAITKEEQIKALAALLKPLGFKKRRTTWYLQTVDTIQAINVQGSQWGPAYYLNVGTYLRALGEESMPPEYRCHIRARIHPPERAAEILVQECQDWFKQFGTVASLITHSRNRTLPVFTTGAARTWLDDV